MITLFIWILLILFSLKLISNVVQPTAMIGYYKESGGKSHTMTFNLPIEILFLIGAIILALFSGKDQWFNKPTYLAIYGSIATVVSYVLMYIVVVIVALIIKRIDAEMQKEQAGAKNNKTKGSECSERTI